MTKQTEAQRLAEYWEARANGLQTWVDENDYVEFGYRPEGLKREQSDQRRTATELRRLDEANKELLEALKINLEVLEKVDPYKGQEDLLVDVVSMNKELIAKATGEQA